MDISYYKKYEPLFNSWYIKKLIGEGSFGKVYEIERCELGETYKAALKVITVPQNQSEIKSLMADGMDKDDVTEYYKSLVQEIIRELVLLSKLKGNSHIVSYEDHMLIEHEDGWGWDILIRMELLTPLYDHLKANELTTDEVVRIGMDLCMALELCQKYNIVHRDVKPENIFISPSGDYKLGDFGIAKTIEKTTSGLSRKGTYTYMAPEVYRGSAYGATVDIYSLGIVMYRLLNDNRTPFLPAYPEKITYSNKEDALVKRIKGEQLPKPAHADERLAEIVLKACAFDPQDRYQSALEMRADLEAVLYQKSEAEQIYLEQNHAPLYSVQYASSSKVTELTTGLSDTTSEEPNDMDAIDDDRTTSLGDMTQGAAYTEYMEPTEREMVSGGNTAALAEPKTNKKRTVLIGVGILILIICAIFFFAFSRDVSDISGIEPEISIYVGDTLEPEYAVEPRFIGNKKIEFSAEDQEIAGVDENGVITGKAKGETTITLQVGAYTEFISVTVLPKVTAIKNVDKVIELSEGETKTLKPKLLPKKFADEKITYKVKNKKIASVSKKGKITAKAEGETKLIISAGGYTKTVKLIVYSSANSTGTPGYSNQPADYNNAPATYPQSSPNYDEPPATQPPTTMPNYDNGYDNDYDSDYDYSEGGDDGIIYDDDYIDWE